MRPQVRDGRAASPTRSTSRTTAASTAPTTAARPGHEITDNGLPTRVRLPDGRPIRATRTRAWTIPLNGADQGRFVPDGQRRGVADPRPRRLLDPRATTGCPQQDAYLRSCARRWPATRSTRSGSPSGPSTGQLWHSADEGESWRMITDTLPEIWAVEARRPRRLTGAAMADGPAAAVAARAVSRAPSGATRWPATTVGGAHRRARRAVPGCATGSSRPGRASGRTSTCSSTASRPTSPTPVGDGGHGPRHPGGVGRADPPGGSDAALEPRPRRGERLERVERSVRSATASPPSARAGPHPWRRPRPPASRDRPAGRASPGRR